MLTYPYIIAYGNRAGIFQPTVSLFCIEGMSGCVKSAVGSNEYIVAELDFCFVQNYTIHIGIKIIAYLYIIAIIAKKWLLYQKTTPCLSE